MPEESYDLGQEEVLGHPALTDRGMAFMSTDRGMAFMSTDPALLRSVERALATAETAGDGFEMG